MFKIAMNDLRIFLGDKMAMALTFALPIALIALFAFIYGGMSSSGEDRPVHLLVVDLDQSELSQRTYAQLDSMNSLVLTVSSLEEAEYKVSRGSYPAVLVLHPGMQDSVNAGAQPRLELKYDPARELEMGLLQGALIGPLMTITAGSGMKESVIEQIRVDYGYLGEGPLDLIVSQVEANFDRFSNEFTGPADSGIEMTPLIPVERTNWGLIQAVAGTVVMMLLFSVAGMGTGLLQEREEGTLKRLLMSPLDPRSILFGKLGSAMIVALMQIVLVFVFAWLVFGLNIFENFPALVLMVITTAWACSCFGIFLAAVSSSRKQVEMMSTLIILIMSAIGGSMIPLPVMPAIMQKLAVISVNYWSIQGFYDIFWRQLTVVEMLPRFLVLMGIGIILTILSQVFFRKNLIKLV